MAELRRILLAGLTAAIPGLIVNSPRSGVLPNTLNLNFPRCSARRCLLRWIWRGSKSRWDPRAPPARWSPRTC